KGSAVIHGSEKIGLTSFLLQCAELAGAAKVKAVYLDLEREYFAGVEALVDRVAELLADGRPEGETQPAGPPIDRLEAAIKNCPAGVLLIFDNAELLSRLVQREGGLGERLVAAFREQVLAEKGASFIFAPGSLEVFREQAGMLFDMSRIFRLGTVELEESIAILTKPLEGRAYLHDEASELLVRLAGGHPYLLHYLGQELVEEINRSKSNLVTLDLAARTVERVTENPPVYLLDLWDELTRREKLLLAAAYSVDGGSELGLEDIATILATHRIEIVPEELAKASADLARRGLVQDAGERCLIARDSLLGRWIKGSCSVAEIGAAEDYDIGEALHRFADELSHSFRLNELAERILKFLETLLHCEWGAFYSISAGNLAASEVPANLLAATGSAPGQASLPDKIASAFLESLILRGETIVAAAPGPEDPPAPSAFEPGSLVLPLLARGEPVGLLVLGLRRDGERYSRRDRSFTRTCAEQAAVTMENVRLYEEETEKERLQQELDTARRMQMAILPERRPEVPGLEFFAYLNPATEVGGDYFDYRLLDSGEFIFLIADVSGHGVSAGTLVTMSKSCVFNQVRFDYGVAEMMTALNDMVRGALAEKLLMTLCYTIFDVGEKTLTYSVAGHPFPYHYSAAAGALSELELAAYPLGVVGKARYQVKTVEFGPGDLFVFYSDGIIEATNPEGEQFGFERFAQTVVDNCGLDAESVAGNILQSFDQFRSGVPQADDVTLVIIKIK
ncbi:MAG TPA: GAF domain-containing SpoIIE family protein phosphatase, partial [Candidatus Glassbacteria bacterium]|nr:GAF domain-containing SpoIIE family protein phosphatase [Candidatus Glassbacteria bacterium]